MIFRSCLLLNACFALCCSSLLKFAVLALLMRSQSITVRPSVLDWVYSLVSSILLQPHPGPLAGAIDFLRTFYGRVHATAKAILRPLYIRVVRAIGGRSSYWEIVMELTRVIEEDD
ncbi:hypothetical protein B0H13DRAFT_1947631 [Mycena leptocephala]|nr:hypothetical protein B0H13DRAFT_1947631 [Mycena leptocephala]